MPLATFSERRALLRSIIARNAITSPGSVFDAASARLAQHAGFECGLLGGSIASHVVLGAPDVNVLTLTEFADQCGRICRGSDLPVIVDADHGYGNALSVRRTIEELEDAGVSALTIEDTQLPRPYGGSGRELISRDEFRDKLRAAVDARSDAAFIVIARSAGLGQGVEETVARVRCANEAGVDGIFLTGTATRELFEAAYTEAKLPLVTNDNNPLPQDELLRLGVRIMYQGHQPYFVALQALYESYLALRKGDATRELQARSISPELRRIALKEDAYAGWAKEFLG
jgi:carboxyvinyl-carboxyphosphonate phosphorylmutase